MGVSKNASLSDIKKAYFTLAKKYHPDLNKSPDSKQKFTEISEAYDTLSDHNKRKKYDSEGYNYQSNQPFKNYNFYYSNFNNLNSDFFKDFLDLFNNKNDVSNNNNDIILSLNVSFLDACLGCSKIISYTKKEKCDICKGSKCSNNESPEICYHCNGAGILKFKKMFFYYEQSCYYCNGEGYTIKNKCKKCKGLGIVYKTVSENIVIPKGVDNEDNLLIKNCGNYSINLKNYGDLYIKINVLDDINFRRNKFDIYSDQFIDVCTAVLGGNVVVNTIYGKVNVKLNSSVKHNSYLNIGNYGVENKYGYKGNHYVKFKVQIPSFDQLSSDEIKLYKELKYLHDIKYKH